ncbi:MAG: hypothetical protein LBT37_01525 [Lactobacillaceae bacterium]|nr:hypothetical protein [Lactobacillaceae bacterium]
MKLHNVLMKSLALGAVVVSLSPLASVATLAHADGTVKSAQTITTTTPVDYLSIGGGVDGVTSVSKDTVTISKNHVGAIQLELASQENGRDIFAGLDTPTFNFASLLELGQKIDKGVLNVPGHVVTSNYQASTASVLPALTAHKYGDKIYYVFDIRDLDLTGKSQIALTFYAKDTGLSKDYSAFINIKRAF